MPKCFRSSKSGSCPNEAAEGSLFCQKHANENDQIKGYILQDEEILKQFEHHAKGNLFSLRQEVTLLRAMINDRLNMANTPSERQLAYREVGNWIGTLDKLTNSLNRLEKETSEVLTRETLMKLAQQMVQVISEEVKTLPGYEAAVDRIATRVVGLVNEASNKRLD